MGKIVVKSVVYRLAEISTAKKPTEARLFPVTGHPEPMPKFIIEREISGAGSLSPAQLQAISQQSCSVLRQMGSEIQWVQSYVTADKIYCVYVAPNAQTVREHAQQGGFPANVVSRVHSVIDPTTAEEPGVAE